MQKMHAVNQWLDTGPAHNPRLLIVFVDGFDTVALGPPSELISKCLDAPRTPRVWWVSVPACTLPTGSGGLFRGS